MPPKDEPLYDVACPGRSDAEPCGAFASLPESTRAYSSIVVECDECGLYFEVVRGAPQRLKGGNHAVDNACICCGHVEGEGHDER